MPTTDFIDRVRDASHIESIAGELTPLNGKGKRLSGCCPFHQEDSPSFIVYVDQNSWHCYGCQRGGSIFDLIMERDKCDFWEAAVHLANKAGIPLPELTEEEKRAHIEREQVETLLSQFAAACHKELPKHPEILEYLHERGITDESMDEYLIGVGVKLPSKIDKGLALASGLLRKSGAGNLYQPMIGRIIFPVRRGGKVIQISARRTKEEDKIKYLSLSRDLYPYNAHALRGDRVVLVEGVMDVILLEQAGFAATASVSSNFSKDWLRLIGRDTDCFVCYDKDDSGAGAAANDTISERLFDANHKAYVIELPEGHDPASFIQAEGAGAFQELLDGAWGYIDYRIDQLPPNLNSHDLDRALHALFGKLVNKSGATQTRYIDKIATRLGIPKASIKDDLRAFIKSSKARVGPSPEESDRNLAIKWCATDPAVFNPAQDVINGVLYYCIHLRVETDAIVPFIITSQREYFRLAKETLLERDFVMDNGAVPSNTRRWSIGSEIPYNVRSYLEGKAHVDPKDLFTKTRWYFTRFLKLPDPFYYDFLTLWAMATYHFRLYDAFGYIFLNAIKGSGKTQALQIMEWLAFNAKKGDAITEAGLKRLVNGNSCTLINDEAERLRKKSEKDDTNLLEVWNGGYKKSGRAILVNKETLGVEEYCTFSPKALANTMGLDPVLEDRCITLYFLKDVGKFPQLVEGEQQKRVAELRNMMYCFSLEYIEGIAEAKTQTERPERLSGRDWELWQPVLTLARFLDGFRVVEPTEFEVAGGEKRTIETLYDRMATMAVERRNYKQSLEEEMNPQAKMLFAIWQYIRINPRIDDTYPAGAIRAAVKEETGWEKFSDQRLSHFIFEDVHICKDRKIDRPRILVDGKRVFHYRLDPDVIKARARHMFGIDLQEPEYGELALSGEEYDDDRDPFEDD